MQLLGCHFHRAEPLHMLLHGLRFVLRDGIYHVSWHITSHELEEVLGDEELRFAGLRLVRLNLST